MTVLQLVMYRMPLLLVILRGVVPYRVGEISYLDSSDASAQVFQHVTRSGAKTNENPLDPATFATSTYMATEKDIKKDLFPCKVFGSGASGSVLEVVRSEWDKYGRKNYRPSSIVTHHYGLKVQNLFTPVPTDAEIQSMQLDEPYWEAYAQAKLTQLVDDGRCPNFVRLIDVWKAQGLKREDLAFSKLGCSGAMHRTPTKLCESGETCHFILMEAAQGSFDYPPCFRSLGWPDDPVKQAAADKACIFFKLHEAPAHFDALAFQFIFAWVVGIAELDWLHSDADRKNTFIKLGWHETNLGKGKTHWCYHWDDVSWCLPFADPGLATAPGSKIPLLLLADYGKTRIVPNNVEMNKRSVSAMRTYFYKFFSGVPQASSFLERFPQGTAQRFKAEAFATALDSLKEDVQEMTSKNEVVDKLREFLVNNFGPGKTLTLDITNSVTPANELHFGFPADTETFPRTPSTEYNEY